MAEQKSAVHTELELVDDHINAVFGDMMNNVRYYAEGALLQTVDSTITSYAGTTASTRVSTGQSGSVERAIFDRFAEFGKSHPAYQYVYMGTEQGGYIQYPATSVFAGFDPRVRPWYPPAKASPDAPILGEPYYFSEDDIVIVGASQAILDTSGSVIGVMAMDMSLDSLTDLFEGASRNSMGNYMLVTQNGTILSDPSNTDNNFLTLSEALGDEFAQAVYGEVDFQQVNLYGTPHFVKSVLSEQTGWYYVSLISEAELFHSVYQLRNATLAVLAVVLVLVLVAGFVASYYFSKPINAMSRCAWQIAAGDFAVDLQAHARGEVGLLVKHFKKIGKTLAAYKKHIGEITSILYHLAQGDVSFEIESEYIGEFGAIRRALLNVSDKLNKTLQQVKSSSDQIMSSSEELAAGAQVLGRGSAQQSQAVEQLSASAEAIAGQVSANTDMTLQANELSKKAVAAALNGNKQMQDMVDAMGEINDRTHEISSILQMIDEIAFQTNILALNAAVEASRAGSAGKGFAVVADEVRNLAQKTASSTQETAALIESSIQAVERGAGVVEQAATSLTGIVEHVEDLSGLLEGVASASSRQSSTIQQTVSGIQQISVVVRDNAAIAEQAAEASEELAEQAALLNYLVNQFRVSGDRSTAKQPDSGVAQRERPRVSLPR